MIIKNWKPTLKKEPDEKNANFFNNFFDAYFFVLDGSETSEKGENSKAFQTLKPMVKAVCDFEKHKAQ